jgi:AraC-like DNA-binding protein
VLKRPLILPIRSDVARCLDLESLGDFGSTLLRQTSLYAAITVFCRLALSETQVASFHLEKLGDDFWFLRRDALGGRPISASQELYDVHLMIQVVKSSAGAEWLPERVDLLASSSPPCPETLAMCEVRFGQDFTGFPIPRALLPRRMAAQLLAEECASIPDVGLADYPAQLRSLMKGFLRDRLVIDDVAAMVGISTRTLQRELTRSGTSFRTQLEEARFEEARAMLKGTAALVTEIAHALGYESPANFSRAFQRWAGVSPREFRNDG